MARCLLNDQSVQQLTIGETTMTRHEFNKAVDQGERVLCAEEQIKIDCKTGRINFEETRQ